MAVKLMVIAGPNKGAAYFLSEGENVIGRAEPANIILVSGQVSKKHCALIVGSNKVELVDIGSSNGTFVNGVLTKKKSLKNKDKISLGPFTLQVIASTPAPARVPKNALSTSLNTGIGMSIPSAVPAGADSNRPIEAEPTSLIAKLKKRVDELVLPVVYDLHEKYDWITLVMIFFLAFIVFNIGFSVYPILESSKHELILEATKRTQYIAKQMEILNHQAILEGKEALLNIDFADADHSVKEAVIINMEGRIMAPSNRQNETHANSTVNDIRRKMLRNQENWKLIKKLVDEDIIVVNPIMVLSKTKGINVPGALAVVVMTTRGVSLDMGTIGVVYFNTFIASMMVGVVFIYLLFHLTMQPIRRINMELDTVLKGGADAVEKKYRGDLLSTLVDTINATLARIPKMDTEESVVATTENEQQIVDNMMMPLQAMAMISSHPTLLMSGDNRVKFMNPSFEELTGIHLSAAQGDLISNVSRDQAFAGLIQDLVSKAPKAGADGVIEEFEFNSGLHKLNCKAITSLPGKAEGFLIIAEKAEG